MLEKAEYFVVRRQGESVKSPGDNATRRREPATGSIQLPSHSVLTSDTFDNFGESVLQVSHY